MGRPLPGDPQVSLPLQAGAGPGGPWPTPSPWEAHFLLGISGPGVWHRLGAAELRVVDQLQVGVGWGGLGPRAQASSCQSVALLFRPDSSVRLFASPLPVSGGLPALLC